MSKTLPPRILWGVAAVLALVAAFRLAGADRASAESKLTCGPGAVVVHVGTKGDGVPLPMAVATAVPTRSVADVAALNKLDVAAVLAPNALGENCLTISGGKAKAPAEPAAAPGK